MNAAAIRHFYNYHFAENRKIFDEYVMPLTQEQFIHTVDYSIGSVRDQIVHMMSADLTWFSGLRGLELPDFLNPAEFPDRAGIRTYWNRLEADMRAYLDDLRDDMLFARPFAEGEDQVLILWQVLLHVVNHGTDHRAQLLRSLHDLGVKTTSQDYIFYVYDHPMKP